MNANIEKFKKRNRRRNAHLYQPGLIQGYDYVICPVSDERMSMIKSTYIEKVLEMSVDEYLRLYPNLERICFARKENIKLGLKQIDPISGLTKYQVSQQKAKQVLSQIDENGISGYKKKGQKTRATHMSKIDELGRNGYSQLATRAIIKGNFTKSQKGIISLNKNEFRRYKIIVLYLTEKYREDLTKGYITGLAGVKNAWHIDHIFSILKGYQQKVSPFVIGHRQNLRMIPWEENLSKKSQCYIELEILLKKSNYSLERSKEEFEKVMNIIKEDIKNNIPPNASYLIERLYGTTIFS